MTVPADRARELFVTTAAVAADLLADPAVADAWEQPSALEGSTVAEYLTTRLVELVVHADDLAVSVGVDDPAPSEDACRAVAGVLAQTAALRDGGLDAVRALAPRERHPQPLRAL